MENIVEQQSFQMPDMNIYVGMAMMINGVDMPIPHGSGIIYTNDFSNMLYEGEFTNGSKNGKGKLYDYDGCFIIEGNFKSDMPDGVCSYSNLSSGKKYFMGMMKNGIPDGYGEHTNFMGITIMGNQKNMKFNGKCKIYRKGKLYYEGYMTNNRKHGYGKIIIDGIEWNGRFIHGLMTGHYRTTFNNIETVGDFMDGTLVNIVSEKKIELTPQQIKENENNVVNFIESIEIAM